MAITKLIADSITSGAIANTPAFSVNMSGNQSLSDNTQTLVAFDTEDFDSDGAFDNSASNYKFTVPSGGAGKYAIFLRINTKDAAQGTISRTYLYKNGSTVAVTEVRTGYSSGGFFSNTPSLTYVADLSVGDYLQGYGRIEGTGAGSSREIQTSGTQFSGFKIIE